MTDREKAIVMAYTGKCMLTGDKLHIFYKYVEEIMGRPVYTHEMGIKAVDDEISEKAKADFIALCRDENSSENPNKWVPVSELPEKSGRYLVVLSGTGDDLIDTAYFAGGMWYKGRIKAWMPVPPYKEESEEE